LERLDVVFTNLAVRRGGQLEVPCGLGRVHLRYISVVRAVQDTAATPMLFGALADKLAETFGADRSTAASVLTELVRQGFLITCLRAPLTITDPLTHLLNLARSFDALAFDWPFAIRNSELFLPPRMLRTRDALRRRAWPR
jgi:hypothetical protein